MKDEKPFALLFRQTISTLRMFRDLRKVFYWRETRAMNRRRAKCIERRAIFSFRRREHPMLYELELGKYPTVAPLFELMNDHLVLCAILKGDSPARIYVDDPSCPQSALVTTRRRFYLAGAESHTAFNAGVCQLFDEQIFPQAREAEEPALVLYYAPQVWENTIGASLRTRFPIQARRQYYIFDALKNDWRALLAPDISLHFVDETLLTFTNLRNLDELKQEVCSERTSVDDFMRNSFGVCLLRDEEVLGWCLSEYNCGDRCEVGIETVEAYRKRRLATVMASALIEHAISRGISHIGWHCFADNVASAATAMRVGFRKANDYSVYLAFLRD
jgi:RimJ/RimL family protein N-acetyltransferase